MVSVDNVTYGVFRYGDMLVVSMMLRSVCVDNITYCYYIRLPMLRRDMSHMVLITSVTCYDR